MSEMKSNKKTEKKRKIKVLRPVYLTEFVNLYNQQLNS